MRFTTKCATIEGDLSGGDASVTGDLTVTGNDIDEETALLLSIQMLIL